jgi:choline dehydrogenase
MFETGDRVSENEYVIVGAGSAGCALAARLTEDPDVHVTVLEAGGPDTAEALFVPPAWPTLWGTEVDWAYETTPQPGSSGQVHQWPRGRVLGGSSSINGMVYIRGNPKDFDAWAFEGNTAWDYASLLPVMKRMENVPGGDPAYRGVGGPIEPGPAARPNPISVAFVEAAREQGHPITDDFNGERFEGAGFHDLTIKDGRRISAAVTYLHPASERPNLQVITGAHVARVLTDGDRAVGVEYVQDGTTHVLHVEREVVLSAGAIDTPAILLRSGIGPAADLAELGVETVVDLPGVGRNLHDHLVAGVIWEARQPVPPPENNLAEASMFVRSHPDMLVPDLHLMFIHVPYHLPTYSVPEGSWTIGVALVRPASRGSLRLRSTSLDDKPLIDPGYLTQVADVEALTRGTRLARELAGAAAFDPWRGPEVLPGRAVQSDAEIEGFVRHAATTYAHPVGTCRMGVGPDAVVDPTLRVRGIHGLRVADASVMPSVVSANTNPASMLIGERASDIIRATEPAPVAAGRAVDGA